MLLASTLLRSVFKSNQVRVVSVRRFLTRLPTRQWDVALCEGEQLRSGEQIILGLGGYLTGLTKRLVEPINRTRRSIKGRVAAATLVDAAASLSEPA